MKKWLPASRISGLVKILWEFSPKCAILPNTWQRARGWALWKACFEIVNCDEKSDYYLYWLKILENILTTI